VRADARGPFRVSNRWKGPLVLQPAGLRFDYGTVVQCDLGLCQRLPPGVTGVPGVTTFAPFCSTIWLLDNMVPWKVDSGSKGRLPRPARRRSWPMRLRSGDHGAVGHVEISRDLEDPDILRVVRGSLTAERVMLPTLSAVVHL